MNYGSSLPGKDELKGFLTRSLAATEKIPLSQDSFDRMVYRDPSLPDRGCSEDDLSQLFRVHPVERVSMESCFTYPFHVRLPEATGTENSFIHLWDSLIRSVVETILGAECISIRDSNQNTNTSSLRPDSATIIRTLCLLRGEEKSPSNNADPRAELIQKLEGWPYSPAPYIFGTPATCSLVREL